MISPRPGGLRPAPRVAADAAGQQILTSNCRPINLNGAIPLQSLHVVSLWSRIETTVAVSDTKRRETGYRQPCTRTG